MLLTIGVISVVVFALLAYGVVNLTHLMIRETIAAGAAPNTPQMLRLWIRNPDAIKPGSKMPAMGFDDKTGKFAISYMLAGTWTLF